jgi:hypothetical protein
METITVLNTDKILLPASANLIGSGWDYTLSGWTPQGALGGYVLRNNGEGGFEIYTGKSNSLGMSVTVTSNGNMGLGTYFPSAKLDVDGGVKIRSGSGGSAICLTLSNNASPGFSIWSSNSSMEIGMASGTGGYSGDATVGDAVIRCSSNLYLQSGTGSSAISITSSNRVGINTKTPQYTLDVTNNARLNTAVIGDAGHGGSWSSFGHSNSFSTTGYAVLHNNNGRTLINCQTGQTIGFRTGNVTDWATFTPTGLGIGTVAPAHKLDVVGNVNATSYTGATITNLSNLGLFGSNTAVWSSNTARWTSNLATDTYYKAVWSSNTAVWTSNLSTDTYYKAEWSSNTARYSSNYGNTLCNFATDAWNRGTYGSNVANWASNVADWSSNQFGGWLGYPLTFPNGVGWWNSAVDLSGAAYAIMQTDTGATAINAYQSNAVYVRGHNHNIAAFSNYTCDLYGTMTVRSNVLVQSNMNVDQWTTLRKGNAAASNTFTHLPFSGDGKNYLRGDVIACDNGGSFGIGGGASSNMLSVYGTTYVSSLKVGGIADAFNAVKFYYATIGGSGGASKITYTFSGILPDNYEVFTSICGSDNTKSDCWCVSVIEKLSGSVKFAITRVDGSSWTQNSTLTMMFIGF